LRRPAGGGARRISGHGGHKRSLRRAAGDALMLASRGPRHYSLIDIREKILHAIHCDAQIARQVHG
jgi:hypothetical protein